MHVPRSEVPSLGTQDIMVCTIRAQDIVCRYSMYDIIGIIDKKRTL